MTKEERCSYCNAPNNGTCAYPSEGKPGCLLEAHRKRMRQALTSKPRFTTDDLRSLMELPDWHRPDEAAIRDFLGWIDNTIETSPSETTERRVIRYSPAAAANLFDAYPEGTLFQRQGRDIIAMLPSGETITAVEPAEAITLCAAPGPSGFICERPKWHPGRHCDGDNRSWLPEKASGRYSCGMQGCPGDHPDLATFCPAGDDDK